MSNPIIIRGKLVEVACPDCQKVRDETRDLDWREIRKFCGPCLQTLREFNRSEYLKVRKENYE